MDALWRDKHIPTGIYRLSVLDRMKFSGFLITKTKANKRFNYVRKRLFCVAKVHLFFESHKFIYKKMPFMSKNINGNRF